MFFNKLVFPQDVAHQRLHPQASAGEFVVWPGQDGRVQPTSAVLQRGEVRGVLSGVCAMRVCAMRVCAMRGVLSGVHLLYPGPLKHTTIMAGEKC